MNILIREALPADMPAVLALIRELARYEKAEHEVLLSEEQLIRDASSASPVFNCLLACNAQNDVLGFCLSWYRYSTWRGRLLYVEDLFLKEDFRRLGIGKQLLDAMLQKAEREGISHVHLQVLDWNKPAIDFYRKHYNPAFDQSWINVLIPVKNDEAAN